MVGGHVAMIGDGLNDSEAFKESDVSIAVRETLSHFTPASDIIIEGKKLSQLKQVLDYAKQSMRLVNFGLVLSAVYNTIGIHLAVQGALTPVAAAILMPISSVSVILLGTLGSAYLARKHGLNTSKTFQLSAQDSSAECFVTQGIPMVL